MTRRTGKTLRAWAALALLAFSLAGCIPAPARPAATAPDFAALGIVRVALLPVVFRDHGQDRYMEYQAGEEIRRQVQRLLEDRGYEVVLSEPMAGRSFIRPFALQETDPSELATLAPSGTDGVVVIWVDHFLDTGLFGAPDHGRVPLEIHATAALISRPQQALAWSDNGIGTGERHFSPGQEWLFAARDLAESLLRRLPPPPR